MYSFGRGSSLRREGLCVELQETADAAIKIIDFSIVCGIRFQDKQDLAFKNGTSHLKWPESKHNITTARPLAEAIDIWPYIPPFGALSGHPAQIARIALIYNIDVQRAQEFVYEAFARLAGVFQACAIMKGHKTIWGGDWNNNGNLLDQKFNDLPHHELVRIA